MSTQAPTGYYSAFVGKGKVTHAIAQGQDGGMGVTLCGKTAEGAIDHSAQRPDAPVGCKSCVKLIEAMPTPEGEVETMADIKNTTADEVTQDMPADEAAEVVVTDGEDAPTAGDEAPTADELREQITANTERIKSIVETGDETEDKLTLVTSLYDEAESLIQELPTGERTALRAALNAAKNGTADEAKGAEVAKADKPAEGKVWTAEEAKHRDALIKTGVRKLKEGVKLHLKTADLARTVAATLLELRTLVPNSKGVPDLKADSDEAKALSRKLYAAAGEGLDGTDDEVREAVGRLIKSVQNVMGDVVVKYVRSLDENPDEAAKFKGILANPSKEQPLSEAVFKAYDIPRKSRQEIQREQHALKVARKALSDGKATDEQRALIKAADEAEAKAKLAASKDEGTDEDAKDEGEGKPAKSKRDSLFDSIGEAEAMLEAATNEDELDELDEDDVDALKAKLDALVVKLSLASAKLAGEA